VAVRCSPGFTRYRRARRRTFRRRRPRDDNRRGHIVVNDVPLTAFTKDLASVTTTRNLSYLTPDLCDDGHDSPCANGKSGGLASANTWLQTWVPRILISPAFKNDGLLVVTFDESDGP
jgi:hypothetical protein